MACMDKLSQDPCCLHYQGKMLVDIIRLGEHNLTSYICFIYGNISYKF